MTDHPVVLLVVNTYGEHVAVKFADADAALAWTEEPLGLELQTIVPLLSKHEALRAGQPSAIRRPA